MDATIHMTVPPEKWKEILQTFKAIMGPIRSEQGCMSCNCYVDAEADNTIFFKNEWTTQEALDDHLRSVHFSVLIGAMKLLDSKPDIRFDTIISTEGAEAIAAARQCG
jgi:quinol monooxygenase YgiN